MSDCELLELAAKAAGLPWDQWVIEGDDSWAPLADDGDALRLAVKLGLACSSGSHVYTNNDDLMGAWADSDVMYGTDLYQRVEWSKSTGDPYAATRRAIVRAAAEIGRAMP